MLSGKHVLSFVLVVIANIVAVALVRRQIIYAEPARPSAFTYIGSDYPKTLPVSVQPVQLEFQDSFRYKTNRSYSMQTWSYAYPENGGIVRLGPEQRTFQVVLFHELHCLAMLNKGLSDPSYARSGMIHITHCLNYLRQSILCESDATLEPVVDLNLTSFSKPGRRLSFTRQCNDWTGAFDFLETNYVQFHEWRTARNTSV